MPNESSAHFRRLAATLREVETDDEPTPSQRRQRIDDANRWRVAHGIPPLREEPEEPPELALYRRVRALGRRSDRG